MSPTPAPAPTPSSPDLAETILHSAWHGITTMAAQQPWLVVLVALAVITAMVRTARLAIHNGPRDPVRLFSGTDKRTLLARAGHRCEFHGPFGGRCRSTERLEADHVHPWARGGATALHNGQILCRTHNRDKRAAIPWNRSLRRLAAHRVSYYPADVDGTVIRKRPSGQRSPTAA